ncbi:hypothetical protein ET445_01780 [Agromyces protaetiae]|uniref:M23ase beta-sheet core domain-containing protein n=1 Tax=Agromyces protaetiae TaxID=2509455 RepID=A0A4P6F9I1_9MICO|nr:M23 family metallopeptidase [Agromyces protaetiae]QAY72255.1 hypothetical protein ET445_01780 [Agromyces protaetiae]
MRAERPLTRREIREREQAATATQAVAGWTPTATPAAAMPATPAMPVAPAQAPIAQAPSHFSHIDRTTIPEAEQPSRRRDRRPASPHSVTDGAGFEALLQSAAQTPVAGRPTTETDVTAQSVGSAVDADIAARIGASAQRPTRLELTTPVDQATHARLAALAPAPVPTASAEHTAVAHPSALSRRAARRQERGAEQIGADSIPEPAASTASDVSAVAASDVSAIAASDVSAVAAADVSAFGGLDELFGASTPGEVRRSEARTEASGRRAARDAAAAVETGVFEPAHPEPARSEAAYPEASARRDQRVAPGRRVAPEPEASAATPARPATGRRSKGVRAIAAMGFAVTLALATSIPALSLLSPEDVQALALASQTAERGPGQRVDLDSGSIIAEQVGVESYQHQSIAEYAAAAGIRPEATFTNNPNGTIQWPFAVGVHIGDRFGYRDCAGCSEDHHGQDFNPGYGAEIQAIADGVVSVSTDDGDSLGVVTMIDHVIDGQVITSVYAHMQYGSRRFEVGDTVKVADIVGLTGTTGMSTGPHLHFEIRIGGVDGEWVDPLEWLYDNTN